MRKFGVGLSSLALGIAVEVSGLHGGIYELIAWGGFVLGGVLVVASVPGDLSRTSIHRRREDTVSPSELQRLGNAILRFVRQRGQEGPSGVTRLRGGPGAPGLDARERRALLEYDADTVAMYFEIFQERVEGALDALTPRGIGHLEVNRLLSPEAVGDLVIVSRRLQELARRARRRSRPRQAA